MSARPISPRKILWLNSLLLGMGVFWILLHFPHDGLWYDETVNAYLATASWDVIWEWSTQVDNQPPLNFAALKIWGYALGTSEFSLRLFSAWCGWLTLAGVIWLGKSFGGRWSAGWFSAVILALSGSFLYAVAEVRTYAFSLALLTWATCFLWALITRPSPKRLPLTLGYILLTVALMFTHHIAFLSLEVHGLLLGWWFLRHRRIARPWVWLIGVSWGGSVAGWFWAFGRRDFNEGTAFAGTVTPATILENYGRFYLYGQKIIAVTDQPAAWLMLVGVVLCILAWGVKACRHPLAFSFTLALAVIPLVGLGIAVTSIEAKLSGRHTWGTWLALALLLGCGLDSLLHRLRPSVLRWGGVLLALSLPITLYSQGTDLPDEYTGDFRQAFTILQAQAEPNDLLILRDYTLFTATEYYHSPIPYIGLPDDKITNVNHRLELLEALQLYEAGVTTPPQAIWVLSWQGETQDPLGLAFALPEYLSEGQGEVWMPPAPIGHPSTVSLTRYPVVAGKTMDLYAHILDLPDVLKIGADGPGLVGVDVYPFFTGYAEGQIPACGVTAHVWWWRGEVDYPSASQSLRVYTQADERLAIQDQPLATHNFGQENWTHNVPVLARTHLEIPCVSFVAGQAYPVELVVYDRDGKLPPQTVDLGTFQTPATLP